MEGNRSRLRRSKALPWHWPKGIWHCQKKLKGSSSNHSTKTEDGDEYRTCRIPATSRNTPLTRVTKKTIAKPVRCRPGGWAWKRQLSLRGQGALRKVCAVLLGLLPSAPARTHASQGGPSGLGVGQLTCACNCHTNCRVSATSDPPSTNSSRTLKRYWGNTYAFPNASRESVQPPPLHHLCYKPSDLDWEPPLGLRSTSLSTFFSGLPLHWF